MTFGEWLVIQQQNSGMKKMAFAKHLGVAPALYIKYVKEETTPRHATMERIASALGMSVEQIHQQIGQGSAPAPKERKVVEARPSLADENVFHRLQMLESEVQYLRQAVELLIRRK